MKVSEFKIKGMTCDQCAVGIAGKFEGLKGIIQKDISYPDGSGKFEYDPDEISKQEIIDVINSTGHYSVAGEIPSGNDEVQYDLIIIGGGSAAFSAAIKANDLGLSTLIVNDGLPFGGTCVNVGCVPSKNLIRAAETVYQTNYSRFEGIQPKGADIDYGSLIQGKNKLVADLQQKKYMDVVSNFDNLKMLKGMAEFLDENTILVNGKDKYKGMKFLIATGSTTKIPDIKGLKETGYLTNVSLFDLEKQPKSMIVLGGGYIALEIAQAYHRLGTKVTLLQRSDHVLSKQTTDIAGELTLHLRNEGLDIHTGLRFIEVSYKDLISRVVIEENGERKVFEAEKILVSTGIKPNTEKLAVVRSGLELTEHGFVKVNDQLQTNILNIYAAGDCINTPSYVYTAAFEGKLAVENAFTGANKKFDYTSLPWVVFTDPQIAGAGMDENEALELGIPHEVAIVSLENVPRSITANDTRGFIKLIRNSETDELLGIRVVAPEGGELIIQASLAIKYGIKVDEIANSLYPYLTLSEGVKLAAITFNKDIKELSCCAV